MVPALELRNIYQWLNDPSKPWLNRPAGTGVRAKNLWRFPKFIEVELYRVEPGGSIDAHSHPDQMEIVICWQGSGKVTIAEASPAGGWGSTYADFRFERYESFV